MNFSEVRSILVGGQWFSLLSGRIPVFFKLDGEPYLDIYAGPLGDTHFIIPVAQIQAYEMKR